MINNILFAEEYEINIPLFLINNKVGSIHSAFNNGMNIRMGNRLFFIGTKQNGLLPFGIHLNPETVQALLSSIQMSSKVTWDDETKQLQFDNAHLSLSLNNAAPYSNRVKDHADNVIISSRTFEEFLTVIVMNDEKTGFDEDIGQFILDYFNDLQGESPDKKVYHLMNAVFSEDYYEIKRVLRYFLGRGKGLTPSGDDYLVGLLAIHKLSGSISPSFLKALTDILEQESVTTDIGKEYLLYALKGEFSSSITNILNILINNESHTKLKDHLLQLMTIGHSSGVDTAFGMLIGLILITNWRI